MAFRQNLDWLRIARLATLATAMAVIAGCQADIGSIYPKEQAPVPERLIKKMKAQGMTTRSPIVVRIYKIENQLEVWKRKDTGRYGLLEIYEICKWSGKLGPKFKEGDRQAPEGFYTVAPAQMNPNSDYHLSFNIGYPNKYDQAHGRTGRHLMVHGACSSAGCYSMTDDLVQEIYSLARDAFKGGQRDFQIQAYPFRMTAENMARHRDNEHYSFWQMLKVGSDHFEVNQYPPKVNVCEKRYVFNEVAEENEKFRPSKECPATTMSETLGAALAQKRNKDAELFNQELAKIEREQQMEKLLAFGANDSAADQPASPATQAEVTQTATVPSPASVGAAAETVPAPEPRPGSDSELVATSTAETKKAGWLDWLTN